MPMIAEGEVIKTPAVQPNRPSSNPFDDYHPHQTVPAADILRGSGEGFRAHDRRERERVANVRDRLAALKRRLERAGS